jgi:hypothetical protein
MSTDQQTAVQVQIADVDEVPRRTPLSQVFSAALREVIADTDVYNRTYRRYMGIDPLYPPPCDDCGGYPAWDDLGSKVHTLLKGGTVRFGYIPETPYVYGADDNRTGFEYDLAALALAKVAAQYASSGVPPTLAATWFEADPGPQGEAQKLDILYNGLVADEFDIAMSGQLVMAAVDAPDAHPDFTCATCQLFTGIYYSGRDPDRLALALKGLVNGTRADLVSLLTNDFADLELRVVSASNPGPSPDAAVAFVSDISAGGGKAWCTFSEDTALVKRLFMGQQVHFAIGDSNQNSTLCAIPGFQGINLNIPAVDRQKALPLAAFTAKPV